MYLVGEDINNGFDLTALGFGDLAESSHGPFLISTSGTHNASGTTLQVATHDSRDDVDGIAKLNRCDVLLALEFEVKSVGVLVVVRFGWSTLGECDDSSDFSGRIEALVDDDRLKSAPVNECGYERVVSRSGQTFEGHTAIFSFCRWLAVQQVRRDASFLLGPGRAKGSPQLPK